LITLTINNKSVSVDDGTTVAAAILTGGVDQFRRSVDGNLRGPLCGMGICFECRVTVNGVKHQKSCTLVVHGGMEIKTDE